MIKEYNIQEENIYNINENKFAIDMIEILKVIINKQFSSNSISSSII